MSKLRSGEMSERDGWTRVLELIGAAIGRGFVGAIRGQESAGEPVVREGSKARAPGRRAKRVVGGGRETRLERGAVVRFRQGRGEFEARVVRVDKAAGTVTLQRLSDGKRVLRRLGVVVA